MSTHVVRGPVCAVEGCDAPASTEGLLPASGRRLVTCGRCAEELEATFGLLVVKSGA